MILRFSVYIFIQGTYGNPQNIA